MSKPIAVSDEQYRTLSDVAAKLGETPDRVIAGLLEYILQHGRLVLPSDAGEVPAATDAVSGPAVLEALAQPNRRPALVILDAEWLATLSADSLRALYRLTHTVYESDEQLLRALGADDAELAELDLQVDADADV